MQTLTQYYLFIDMENFFQTLVHTSKQQLFTIYNTIENTFHHIWMASTINHEELHGLPLYYHFKEYRSNGILC